MINHSNKRILIDLDFYGKPYEDATERYHNEPDHCELNPVGDLFDDELDDEDDSDEEE